MLRIRLRRVGKKKQPMYRIVVADSHAPRDGAFVESIGYYHPMNNPSTIVLDEARAKHWLDHGAQPSERVSKILHIQGIAELPSKLVTRMELGAKRAEEAKVEKAKAEKAAAAEAAAAPPPAAPAAEAPAPEAKAEEPASEAPAEEAAAEAAPAANAEEPAAE
jgi:small subunit ribosomal protein S16